MRSSILLLVLSAIVLGSCTSAYKTGQTPDDVYFSPQRSQNEYVDVKDNDNRYNGSDDQYYEDEYLRMKVHNRLVWSQLDDYYYSPGYNYGYYNSLDWNNPWSGSTYWNYYYNPYCSPVFITSKTSMVYNHPRVFNLNTYTNNQTTSSNYSRSKNGSGTYNNGFNTYNRPVRMVGVGSSNNSGSSTGNFLRNIFNSGSSNNNNSNSSFSNPSRSSSSSSSSSGGGGGGGTAPVRRF